MKSNFSILALCIFSFVFLAGCKKGEEDPSFSLRTRKQRFSGDWQLIRGFVISTNKNTVVSTTYDGNSFTTTSSLNPELVINGSYFRTISINNDGTFIEEVNKDNQYNKEQGLWTFLSGNDLENLKNKEAVLFKVSSQFNSNGNILNQFEGEERPLITIRLKKLTNDEMVWSTFGNMDEQKIEGELTWITR